MGKYNDPEYWKNLANRKKKRDAEPEPHYCRECKWSWCHINVGKHGETETYLRCLNWDDETDEEGFCHKWERKDYDNRAKY